MNIETKFTKGPWCVSDSTVVYKEGEQGHNIFWSAVSGMGCCSASDGELKANAQLIAAAPELYEALDELTRVLCSEGYRGSAIKGLAALTKARGE